MTVVQHLIDALSAGSLYALLALGIALIFGIVRLVNFAYGELIMLAGYVLVLMAGVPAIVVLPVAIASAAVLSLATERLAFRPARGADPATLLVTSFAVSYLLQNLGLLTFGSLTRSADVLPGLTKPMEFLGVNMSRLDLVVIVVTAVLLLAFTQFLRRTDIGTQMRAAAEDFDMARLLGVRANRVIAVAFGLSGVLAGVAAIALIAKTGSVTPTVGVNVALFGFIAVILGGMGSLSGAVLGGYVLGALTVLLQVVLPEDLRAYRDAFLFAAVLALLVLRPQGLIVASSQKTRV